MSRVVVVGGAGMIGYCMSSKLHKLGHEVTVIDNLERSQLLGHTVSNERKTYNFNKLHDLGVRCFKWDISEHTLNPLQFDLIVNLAAQCSVPISIEDPRRDFQVNTVGTLNVLEAARKNDAKVAYASTNKIYNLHSGWTHVDGRWRWTSEDWDAHGFPINADPKLLGGSRTPYGNSKYMGDLMCQEWYNMYGLKTGIFRMSCIYGDHQFSFEEQGWLLWFIIANLKGEAIDIFGDGDQVRDVLWVEDAVDAYIRYLFNSDVSHGVWQLGGGPEFTLSLNEAIEEIQNQTGRDFVDVRYRNWRPSDQKIYTSDIRPVMKDLNWKPKTSPADGIALGIEWVKENLDIF